MTQHDINLLIAAAINRANGSYTPPVFGGVPTTNNPSITYTSGYYRSVRSYNTAGQYGSEQSWSGSNGVIMTYDPIGGINRQDIAA